MRAVRSSIDSVGAGAGFGFEYELKLLDENDVDKNDNSSSYTSDFDPPGDDDELYEDDALVSFGLDGGTISGCSLFLLLYSLSSL
ncbi:hypothetical protein AGMMS49592_6350 [Endomicrobiia bacterium]|nr:hypothetical protein AGMMS49592_6350 [Endomicrobiia bacterium]